MEPALRFLLTDQTPRDVVVRVFFWLEFLPPWTSTPETSEDDVWLELRLNREGLPEASDSLRTDLSKFPWRYPDRPDLRPRVVTPQGRRLSEHAAQQVKPDSKK